MFFFAQAPPPFGKKIIIMTIEIDEGSPDTTLSVVWTGATFPFKDRLSEHGVPGGRIEQEDGEKGAYFRVLKDLDVSVEENQDKVVTVVRDCFDELVMQVKIAGDVPKDSDTESFLDKLKEDCPNLHFYAEPTAEPAAAAAGGGA